MSHAITALLLLQLDRVPGEWVAVDQMAHHLSLARPVVCDHLQPLAAAGQVWLQRADNGLILAAKSPPGDCGAEPDAGPQTGPAEEPAVSAAEPAKPHTPYPRFPNLPAGLLLARAPAFRGWGEPTLRPVAAADPSNTPAKEPAHDITR